MNVEVFNNKGDKVAHLEDVTVEDKPTWVTVRSNKPYSLDSRVFAKGTFQVVAL